MSRRPSSERVLRMLSLVPFVASHPDGVAIEELCRRFDVDRTRLLADLETVQMVGMAPFSPDVMVEVITDDERVWVNLPQAFTRPLRLSPEQGLALLARTQGLRGRPGADEGGPLDRGLAKLARALGIPEGEVLDVELGRADAGVARGLEQAIAQRRQVELDYYSYGRDEHTHRVVDPYRLYGEQGQWYLEAWCHERDGERLFRLDRISAVELRDETFERSTTTAEGGVFRSSDQDPVVALELAAPARWVAEQYPVEQVDERDDGGLRITVRISALAWLERLLLRLGPDATVVEAPPELADAAAGAARRILARYAR